MAGCFGNSDFDRNEERKLMNHLNEESNFDSYLNSILEDCSKIEPVLSDTGDFEIFWDRSDECDTILQENYVSEKTSSEIAKLIMDKFISLAR